MSVPPLGNVLVITLLGEYNKLSVAGANIDVI